MIIIKDYANGIVIIYDLYAMASFKDIFKGGHDIANIVTLVMVN